MALSILADEQISEQLEAQDWTSLTRIILPTGIRLFKTAAQREIDEINSNGTDPTDICRALQISWGGDHCNGDHRR